MLLNYVKNFKHILPIFNPTSISLFLKYSKKQKGKSCGMDLPMLKKDISKILGSQKHF